MRTRLLYSGDKIHSTRNGVNVLYPFGRNESDMNHHFKPVNRRYSNESINDYLRRCVYDVLAEMQPGWWRNVEEVTIRDNTISERGLYHWTARGPFKTIRVNGPVGNNLEFVDDYDADKFIRNHCIGGIYVPMQFSKTVIPE